jgi:hypothetical protein
MGAIITMIISAVLTLLFIGGTVAAFWNHMPFLAAIFIPMAAFFMCIGAIAFIVWVG